MTSTRTRPAAKTPRPAPWPTLAVADLTARVSVPEADPAMVESVTAHGITEPLYVAALDSGAFRVVDGMRRLAAAVAAGLDVVPVTYRPVIRVDALTEHPGNVRRNLALTKEFRASIREHGIRTAVLVRRTATGLEVVDGHRRLLGAVGEGLTHIPYTYDEISDAAAYVDMVTTAVHRAPLTTAEQAAALFEAAELGATARELAAAAGKSQKEARAMVKAGGSSAVVKVAAAPLSLADLARLAELEEQAPDLAEEVETAITARPDGGHAWRITDALSRAAARKEAADHRAQLTAQGVQFRTPAELCDKAVPVHRLRGTSVEEHAVCQGHVWVLTSPDSRRYTPYCSNAVVFGHELTGGETKKVSPAERRRIIAGNGHWDAATQVRREWLAELLGRTGLPKAVTDPMLRIAAGAMMTPDAIVQSKQAHPRRTEILAQLLGMTGRQGWKDTIAKRAGTVRRAPAHLFATVAACYELYVLRTAWRTDEHHGGAEARRDTARYLGWLVELGYRPCPIEAAVIDDTAYDPAGQCTPAQCAPAQDADGTAGDACPASSPMSRRWGV